MTKIVIYKDGSSKIVEDGITWEYENDPDWLKTIDYTDINSLAEDCWLFLTNDSMPEKATISKEAFMHEVGCMLSIVKQRTNEKI